MADDATDDLADIDDEPPADILAAAALPLKGVPAELIRTRSAAKQRAIDTVDGWMEKPPRALRMWLKKGGFPAECLPAKVPSKMAVQRRLQKAGLWEHCEAWKKQACAELRKSVCPGRNWNISAEIVWRLIEEWAELHKHDLHAIERSVTAPSIVDAMAADPRLGALPLDICWLYMHPGLGVKDDTEPAVRTVIVKYETENPCPNQGVRSRYNFLRLNADKMNDFFKHVDKLMLEAGKTPAENDGEGGEEKLTGVDAEERDLIEDLEGQLGNWQDG